MAVLSALGSKPCLWCVLVLTVGAAIVIVAGISGQAAKFPAVGETSATER
jgi:hypothetical protein